MSNYPLAPCRNCGAYSDTATIYALASQPGEMLPRGYARRVRWTSPDGSSTTFETSGHASQEEADAEMARMLADSDWTPLRWWKFWRWNDTRFEPQIAAEMRGAA